MKQRFLTGAAMFSALILILFARQLSTVIFDIFIIIIATIAAYEMTNLLAKQKFYNLKIIALCYPALAYGLYMICLSSQVKFYLLIVMQVALLVFVIGAVSLYGMFNSKASLNEIKTRNLRMSVEMFSVNKAIHTALACLYPCALFMFFILLNNLKEMNYLFFDITGYTSEISLFAIILTFLIPVFTDTFAYLTGSLFKGKKLCPKISPNKTISGAIGGTFWGTASAVILFLIFNSISEYALLFKATELFYWHFIVVGFVASIMCQVGDLFESYLKRKANVKDSGKLLPGHGGILDRMDSHIVCVTVIFIFMAIVL